ncbi:MAG: hypothetical protein IJ668_00400, partial [Selenomonadaceae bacterium]|nr:hypothetical protein [Selenomonadaceae bacterium]
RYKTVRTTVKGRSARRFAWRLAPILRVDNTSGTSKKFLGGRYKTVRTTVKGRSARRFAWRLAPILRVDNTSGTSKKFLATKQTARRPSNDETATRIFYIDCDHLGRLNFGSRL